MRSNIIKIALALAAFGLSFWLYRIIQAPIEFNNKHKVRKERVIDKMMNIRTAQLAFKVANGNYSDNFDELLSFADTGRILIIQTRDSTYEAMNQVYQIMEIRDTIVYDTLGYVGVKDSLFKDVDVYSLRYIPFAKNKTEFEMDAGRITQAGDLKVQVFEIIARKELWMKGMDKALISTNADDLIIGSMNEATISGNWQ